MKPNMICGIIKTHREKTARDRRIWDRYLAWYLSEQQTEQDILPQGAGDAEDTDVKFDTNYPYAWIDTMIANVVPQNPQNDWHAFDEDGGAAGTHRSVLNNYVMREQDLADHLWSAAAKTSLYGRSFIKTTWNFKTRSVEYYAVDPRYIFFDMSARRWRDIRYICEVTVVTRDEFNRRMKKKGKQTAAVYPTKFKDIVEFGSFPKWLETQSNAGYQTPIINEASRDVLKWVVVYEFYDFTTNKFYHFLENHEEPLFSGELPYSYVKNPFSMLKFTENHRDLGGLSDIKLISSAKERLDELDTLELWYAHSSIPITFVDESKIENTQEFKNQFRDATGPGEAVFIRKGVDDGGLPLQNIFFSSPMPSLNPSWDKMRARAADSISYVLGLPEFSRGQTGAQVATEVALSDAAMRTRNGRRQKKVFRLIRELGGKTIALFEEFLDRDIKIYDPDRSQVFVISRQSIRARESGEDGIAQEGPEVQNFEVMPVPYSPTESDRLVKLQRLEKYLPYLMQGNPHVDIATITQELLDLLGLSKAYQQAQEQPPGPPGAQPGDNPQGGPVGGVPGGASTLDSAAGGGLPLGAEPPPVAGVMRGTGDQSGGGMF